jgi:hypothetical protein
LKHWVASPILSILEFEPLLSFSFVASNSRPRHHFLFTRRSAS